MAVTLVMLLLPSAAVVLWEVGRYLVTGGGCGE